MSEESEQLPIRRNENILEYKIRRLERIAESNESRIRDLEDFKLRTQTTHRNMVTWISITAATFSAAISLLEHLIFK